MHNSISSPEPDAVDKDFFQRLRRELDHQISNYVYESSPDAIGIPLTEDVIRGYLKSMQLWLVEPHWEDVHIRNTPEEIQSDLGVHRRCVTMAEEEGYVLVFDPVDEEYHLAWRSEYGLATWGIRGDGVGCFIAR